MTAVRRPDRSRPRAMRSRLRNGLWLAAINVLGALGWGPFRSRVRENAAVLSDLLPVHSKWWRDQAKAEGELLYVALGDSAAQGIGATSPDRSYVGVLAGDIRKATGRSLRVINLSVSGATTALAVEDQLPRFRALEVAPDIVTVAIGANDIAGWDPEAFRRNLRTIFAALPSHAIVADVPCFHLRHNERKVAVANRMLRDVAREYGLTLAPLHETTRRQGIVGILTQFAQDMFHPNDHGYEVWAEAFRPALLASVARRIGAADAWPAREPAGVGGAR
ncbi:SGNH/GDSL hydrolase family protein [Agromyces albus]|nr:SGNH/GDSL hydrolase family protein [Agromyces albus]